VWVTGNSVIWGSIHKLTKKGVGKKKLPTLFSIYRPVMQKIMLSK